MIMRVQFARIPGEITRGGKKYTYLSGNTVSMRDIEFNKKSYRNHMGMVRRYRQKGHVVINETNDPSGRIPNYNKRWMAWINGVR
jgi:hypothetical protein